MALKLVVDTLEGMSDAIKAEYVKDDATGKFKLNAEGLPDTSRLERALDSERDIRKNEEKARKTAETKLAAFGDMNPDSIKQLMAALENDEEAKLIAKGEVKEVIKRRTEKAVEAANRQVEEATKRETAANERVKNYEQRVLDNHVRAAAEKAGLHAGAIEDALLHARGTFTLDEKGNAVQLGSDNKPVLGSDAKSPFSPSEWLEGLKATKPHWFRNGNAGGGAGGDGGAGGAKTMKRADWSKLTPVEQAAAVKTHKIID